MVKDNSGQAFPSSHHKNDPRNPGWIGEGMTLRQWYAGQALIGFLSLGKDFIDEKGKVERLRSKSVSRACYVYADAMIAEGSKE